MPEVPLKFIVSFSSQDPRHPAEGILLGDGAKRWLSSPSDRTGQLYGIIQLDRMCRISHIDIGVSLAFTVQVLVGRSNWPSGQEYVTLLPNTPFMTLMECRKERSKTSLRMFNKEHFCQNTLDQKWDRLKIICSQPYRKDVQIGISLLRVTTEEDLAQSSEVSREAVKNVFTNEKKFTPERRQSSGDIHRHFFGDAASWNDKVKCRDKLKEELKSSLTKIAASVENGNVQEANMSRNVKLVLAANPCTPKFRKPSESNASEVKSATPKQRPSLQRELDCFLDKLDVKNMDMENLTFADLRHKFEKQKLRKLSKEERKLFFKKAQVLIEKAILAQDSIPKDKISVVPHTSSMTLFSKSETHNDAEYAKGTAHNGKLQSLGTKRKLCSPDENPGKRLSLGTNSGLTEDIHKTAVDMISQKQLIGSGQGNWNESSNQKNNNERDSSVTLFGHGGKGEDWGREKQLSASFSVVDLTDDRACGMTSYVTCSLCGGMYPTDQMNVHAIWCKVENYNNTETDDEDCGMNCDDQGQCPSCGLLFDIQQLICHAEECATKNAANVH